MIARSILERTLHPLSMMAMCFPFQIQIYVERKITRTAYDLNSLGAWIISEGASPQEGMLRYGRDSKWEGEALQGETPEMAEAKDS